MEVLTEKDEEVPLFTGMLNQEFVAIRLAIPEYAIAPILVDPYFKVQLTLELKLEPDATEFELNPLIAGAGIDTVEPVAVTSVPINLIVAVTFGGPVNV